MMVVMVAAEKQAIEKAGNAVDKTHVFHLRSSEPIGTTVPSLLTVCIYATTCCHGTLRIL
jgi:hypothetical protein